MKGDIIKLSFQDIMLWTLYHTWCFFKKVIIAFFFVKPRQSLCHWSWKRFSLGFYWFPESDDLKKSRLPSLCSVFSGNPWLGTPCTSTLYFLPATPLFPFKTFPLLTRKRNETSSLTFFLVYAFNKMISESIHAKSGWLLWYITANFFGFSAKF